jgi:hypothetical protein
MVPGLKVIKALPYVAATVAFLDPRAILKLSYSLIRNDLSERCCNKHTDLSQFVAAKGKSGLKIPRWPPGLSVLGSKQPARAVARHESRNLAKARDPAKVLGTRLSSGGILNRVIAPTAANQAGARIVRPLESGGGSWFQPLRRNHRFAHLSPS